MAKSGTMDVETQDGSLANGTSNDHSEGTKSDQPSDEDDEEEKDLEKYTKALLASLSINDSDDVPEETSEDNHYDEEDYALEDSLFQEDNKITTATSLVVESLLQDLCQVYTADAEQARRCYKMICQILYQMRVIDESYKMREFEGMRNQYQRVFHHLLNTPVGSSIPAWPSNDVTNEWSHYHREFDEINYIAGGGFGKVFLVKHKLDDTDYAVKKISIRSEGIKSVMKYLSEVKTFAALNHANIVQYKAAWLELGENANNNNFSDNSDDESVSDDSATTDAANNTNSFSKGDNAYIYPDVISTVEIETSFKRQDATDSSEFEINFQESPHYSYNNATRSRSVKRTKRQSFSEGSSLKNGTICTMQDIKNMRLEGRQQRATVGGQKWATLYIQMALCPSTLQQWLQQRNLAEELAEQSVTAALVPVGGCNVRYQTIVEILKQLLKGLKYIHSKKIVHHDIKPSNIFIQEDNGSMLVQLGDFGLACPLQSARHSIAGGTKLYAAPEQIQGTCVSKSDMYSLGIVLLELTASFRTDMERVRSITELRKTHGQSAADVLIHSSGINDSPICQSRIASIISQVMVRTHADRPDANGLLAILIRMVSDSPCSKTGAESACRDSNTCVDMTILVKELRTQLAQKDAEIIRLRDLLKQAGIPGDDIDVT